MIERYHQKALQDRDEIAIIAQHILADLFRNSIRRDLDTGLRATITTPLLPSGNSFVNLHVGSGPEHWLVYGLELCRWLWSPSLSVPLGDS